MSFPLRNGIALGLLAVLVMLALGACSCSRREDEARPRIYHGGQYYGDAVHQ